MDRREFLRIAGIGTAGVGLVGAGGYSGYRRITARPTVRRGQTSFVSRPDLTPPRLTVTRASAATAHGLVFTTPALAGAQQGPMIFDNQAEAVWIKPLSGVHATNFRVQVYQGEPVLTWWEGTIELPAGYGMGTYVIADSSYKELARVQAGNGAQGDLHEFVITPQGTALMTVYRTEPADLSALGGPATGTILESMVQEVDIATGRVVFEWRSHDHVDLTESYRTPTAGVPFDYFHVNSIDVDTDDNLLVSARHTWTVYKLDRQTGKIMWRLGGKNGDFTLGPGVRFAGQHDVNRQLDGTITVFDDGDDGETRFEESSRGITLNLDESSMTATLLRQDVHPGDLHSHSQGSMRVLANGNAFVGYGSLPNITEFDPVGRVVFDAHLPAGAQSYRSYRFAWVAKPVDKPAVGVLATPLGHTQVHVSWNGATEVANWTFLAGQSPGSLQVVGSAPRHGFETMHRVPGPVAFVAVAAHDATGELLGTSDPVQT
ncbi:MAG: arylsulfotransferase family protein [Acidimicrobiales bacterium]